MFKMPITKVDDEGKEYHCTDDEVMLDLTWVETFARAYYRDEMKAKGLNPDFQLIYSMMTTQKEIQNIMLMRVQ